MKKFTTLVSAFFLILSHTLAEGGWATSSISISKNKATEYQYTLNNEGWTDGDWESNTAFDGFDFGTPQSLILNGGSGNAWTDECPGHNLTSFKIMYRVYKSGTNPGKWSQLDLTNSAYRCGYNILYNKNKANIDILALATESGTNTYILEVVMSKKQMNADKCWNSMIPGGQCTPYNEANDGYKATFVKSITTATFQPTNKVLSVITTNKTIQATFDNSAQIKLYSTSGQLIDSSLAQNSYSKTVKSGAYVLTVNGISHKILVQ